ncbi:MAG: IclR family transcriptional regulator [Bryobacteraceae bacterium]|nr:IclR family transcriptional regulator [Bryobacteraceae bacterium]
MPRSKPPDGRPSSPRRVARAVKPDRDPSTRAVLKAFEALELVRCAENWLTLQEIADAVGLVKSSTYRLLRSLESTGLVESSGGAYRLTGHVGPLLPISSLKTLVGAAKEPMRDLSMSYRECVSLAYLFENHMEVVAMMDSPETVSVGNVVGRILPPNASSLGKSIMAFQTVEKREQLLRCYGLHRFTQHTIVDPLALSAELAVTAKRGYATDAEENAIGGCCFGVPLRQPNGLAFGAISVSFLKPRVPEGQGLEQFIAKLRGAAAAVEERMFPALNKK